MQEVKSGCGEHRQVLPEEAGGAAPRAEERTFEAVVDQLPEVLSFVEEHLEKAGFGARTRTQIMMACEEIFVNIADYAYIPGRGSVLVRLELTDEPAVEITFTDEGVPFDPLAKKDPNVTLSAEERQIGGLGIFMAKELTDRIAYERRDGRNILKMTKLL